MMSMAAELLQEKPYKEAVDLWSLGVILFELYKGEPPFYTNNIYSLIQLIIKDKVKYPSGMSRSFKDFLQVRTVASAWCAGGATEAVSGNKAILSVWMHPLTGRVSWAVSVG